MWVNRGSNGSDEMEVGVVVGCVCVCVCVCLFQWAQQAARRNKNIHVQYVLVCLALMCTWMMFLSQKILFL